MVGRILHRIIRSAGGAGGEAMLWAETDVTPGIYISSFSLHVFQQLCYSLFPFYPLLSLMEFNLTFRIGNYIINYHRNKFHGFKLQAPAASTPVPDVWKYSASLVSIAISFLIFPIHPWTTSSPFLPFMTHQRQCPSVLQSLSERPLQRSRRHIK